MLYRLTASAFRIPVLLVQCRRGGQARNDEFVVRACLVECRCKLVTAASNRFNQSNKESECKVPLLCEARRARGTRETRAFWNKTSVVLSQRCHDRRM